MSELIDLHTINQNIVVDLKYASPDNFTGEALYSYKKCYLLKKVALALDLVQKELEKSSLGLKVWDGYRPMSVQERFWQILPDEQYIANPKMGGRHTRGTAVDLTLITKQGKELLMPSLFDEFNEKAHRDYKKGPKEALDNSKQLENLMHKYGFEGISTEWWHFDFNGWKEAPLLKIEISSLI